MIAENYLEYACRHLSVVNRIISEYGDMPLADYLRTCILKPMPSYQKRDDFFDAVFRYVSPLLGENIAEQAVSDLKVFPVVLTSNHLGVEYFAQSLQSSILFSLNVIRGRTSTATVPVFSCANIPLNNLTYPQGLLIYDIHCPESDGMPKKIPIFPNRLRKSAVSVAPAFDKEMIRKAKSQSYKMISDTLLTAIDTILEEDYSSDSILTLPYYSEQAVILNNRIWKRLFSKLDTIPNLICLELEKISAMLLEYDLSDTESLATLILFDAEIRKHILDELDGVKGCWERKYLEQCITNKQNFDKNHGTVFFWGIDNLGKRRAFWLTTHGTLERMDDNGMKCILNFTPETILQGLREKQLIPSLFTCYMVLAFARGLVCLGGYFQGEYLAKMQIGIINALRKTGYDEITQFVAQASTDRYLSGMLAVMRQTEGSCLIPASTIEIIAGGGITNKDIEKIGSLTVRDAHIAGLFETAPDAVPSDMMPAGWKKSLAEDCYNLLKEKVVVK